MNHPKLSSFTHLDNVYLNSKNPFSDKKCSVSNLTLTVTKASLIDSAAKSLVDIEQSSKDLSKNIILPSLDPFPQSFKSRVSPSSSVKRVSSSQKFDNHLQSYFYSTKRINEFSQMQTQAPPSPEKQDRKNSSYHYQTPKLYSNNQISLSQLTELNLNSRSQNPLNFTQEVNKQNAKSLEKNKDQKNQKMQLSQNHFNISRQSVGQPQILKIDVLKDKQKIVQLINKDRKEKQVKNQAGQNRQVGDTIVEKVKREEKNFYVSFSLLDTSAHKLLKDVKCNEENKGNKKQKTRIKKTLLEYLYGNQKQNNTTNQNQDYSFYENQQKIDSQAHLIFKDDNFSIKDKILQPPQPQLDSQSLIAIEDEEKNTKHVTQPDQHENKECIEQKIEEEEINNDHEEQLSNQVNKVEKSKYESLLSPIQELNSFKQSTDNYRREEFSLKNDEYLSERNNDVKISQYEGEIYDRKTSLFKARDQDFVTVTVTSPKKTNQSSEEIEQENKQQDILKIPIQNQLSLKLEDDLKKREEKEEFSQQLSPFLNPKTPASKSSEKNVFFDLSQDKEKSDHTPASSIKSVQIQSILKKKTMLSVEGTDQSESDFTATNKQNKITFSNIERQKTINTKQVSSPRKSYFKSFSQAVNNDNNQSQNEDNGTSNKKLKSDENIHDKEQKKQKFINPQSSEYADDEFKDRSESNISDNTSFYQNNEKDKNGYKRSKTNQKSDVSIEDHSPDMKKNKQKNKYKNFKSHQRIEVDDSSEDQKYKGKSVGNIRSMKSIHLKKKKSSNNKKEKSKNHRMNSSSVEDDDDIESLYENMINNDTNADGSFTDINQDGQYKKMKSKKYSLQINDLAEFVEMEQKHTLSLGSIATLFMKLHKAKKRALIHLKAQPQEPIRINELEMSSYSDLDNLSMLRNPNKKDQSQSNFNDYYEEYDQDSLTPGSFVIQSLADHLNDFDPLENASNQGDGTSNHKNKRNILHKLMTKKSLGAVANSKIQKLQQLKTKQFDRTPSNNFELRNVRKNEMHLLKQKIENIYKEFKIEGLKLDQKKTKMRKLIQEIEKVNIKNANQEKKKTQNLISAINEQLDYEKQTDELYFEETMANAPIINEDLEYFQKMKLNKINDPKYIMKFEEQIKMNRDRDFISELKKENVIIDDQMLFALQRNKIMNENDKAALERKNNFMEQRLILQKLGLLSLEDFYKQIQITPEDNFILQTELDYQKALQENQQIQLSQNNKDAKNMKSIKLNDAAPQKILEKKIDKFLELSKKVKNLPVEKLNNIKAKLNQISTQTKQIEESDQFHF